MISASHVADASRGCANETKKPRADTALFFPFTQVRTETATPQSHL